MALLTPMSLAQARSMGGLLGIEVDQVEAVARGINSNFVLRLTDGSRVFARVCERCSRPDVEAQAALLARVAEAEVPTPRPLLRRDGKGAVVDHDGKPTLLFPFCPGRDLCQASVRPAHTEQLGRALGRLHRALAGVDYPSRGRAGPAELRHQLDGLLARADVASLWPELQTIAHRLQVVEIDPRAAPEPETVVHGDLFRDNVLWVDGELTGLLDFEFAARDSGAYDLMVTMLAWCFTDRFERPLARALLRGYGTEQKLSRSTRASLFSQARRAALRFALSRIDDYELRPRGAIQYKDFRRFLARLDGLHRDRRAELCRVARRVGLARDGLSSGHSIAQQQLPELAAVERWGRGVEKMRRAAAVGAPEPGGAGLQQGVELRSQEALLPPRGAYGKRRDLARRVPQVVHVPVEPFAPPQVPADACGEPLHRRAGVDPVPGFERQLAKSPDRQPSSLAEPHHDQVSAPVLGFAAQ